MKICKVIGTPTSTFKVGQLEGSKLLLVLPLNPMNMRPAGTSFVSVDRVGAGKGSIVLVSEKNRKSSLVDATVVGILDTLEIEGRIVYDVEDE